METVLLSIVGFALVLLAMGIGVLFGRRPLRGSCGGVGGQCDCGATSTDDCRQESSSANFEAALGEPRETR
jgi:hypothetical protein